MNSRQILDNRSQHRAVGRTTPQTWEGKGTVHQIKWEDGIITSLYDYKDGDSTHLHVVDADWYEKEYSPIWIPETEWRKANPSYHDGLLAGRSY